MHCKTKGIVFHQLKYSDTSIIVKIYTEYFGLQSYIFKGVRKKNAILKASIFQPLSLVEIVVNHKANNSIQHVKEIRNINPFTTIYYDVKKSSMILFINELLYKAIREEEVNKPLFDFIFDNVILLDKCTKNYADFHLCFTLKLTRYLGFIPTNNYSDNKCFFNLNEGIFQNQYLDNGFYANKQISFFINKIFNDAFDSTVASILSRNMRNELLKTILLYYRIHLASMKELYSHIVLEEVFN